MNDPENVHCQPYSISYEDLQMGFCLQSLDIPPGDTTDTFGMARLFAYHPTSFTFPGDNFIDQFLLTAFHKKYVNSLKGK